MLIFLEQREYLKACKYAFFFGGEIGRTPLSSNHFFWHGVTIFAAYTNIEYLLYSFVSKKN
jgi:hypothetical protein